MRRDAIHAGVRCGGGYAGVALVARRRLLLVAVAVAVSVRVAVAVAVVAAAFSVALRVGVGVVNRRQRDVRLHVCVNEQRILSEQTITWIVHVFNREMIDQQFDEMERDTDRERNDGETSKWSGTHADKITSWLSGSQRNLGIDASILYL